MRSEPLQKMIIEDLSKQVVEEVKNCVEVIVLSVAVGAVQNDALKHMLRINRLIEMQRGSGLLVGGRKGSCCEHSEQIVSSSAIVL